MGSFPDAAEFSAHSHLYRPFEVAGRTVFISQDLIEALNGKVLRLVKRRWSKDLNTRVAKRICRVLWYEEADHGQQEAANAWTVPRNGPVPGGAEPMG